MGAICVQALWELARKQHGVVARRQLPALGFTSKAIKCALEASRLHRTEFRGVYSAGRPGLTKHGRLMAAVLWAGEGAVLSHDTAADLWGIRRQRGTTIHLSLPSSRRREKKKGVVIHRPAKVARDRTWGIPLTTPLRTLIDLAAKSTRHEAARLIDQADAQNLIRADSLREQLEHERGPGVPLLKDILDRDAFVLTESELERLLVPIAERAGIGTFESQVHVNGHRVDLYFPDLDVVVEANSLRYHRTQHQQRKDSLRAQAHAATGTVVVPFLHFQIAREQDYVVETLRRVSASAARRAAAGSSS
jgi:very-short-patch-repair endonuclease